MFKGLVGRQWRLFYDLIHGFGFSVSLLLSLTPLGCRGA